MASHPQVSSVIPTSESGHNICCRLSFTPSCESAQRLQRREKFSDAGESFAGCPLEVGKGVCMYVYILYIQLQPTYICKEPQQNDPFDFLLMLRQDLISKNG